MKLQDVLLRVKTEEIVGNTDVDISDVQIDSRQVGNGCMFIAERGTQVDGHKFIPDAIQNGATVVVCEEMPTERPEDVTFVRVKNSEDAVGPLCTRFYGDPATK